MRRGIRASCATGSSAGGRSLRRSPFRSSRAAPPPPPRPERLGRKGHRPGVDHGQPDGVGVGAGDQVRERLAGKVGRRDPVAGVAGRVVEFASPSARMSARWVGETSMGPPHASSIGTSAKLGNIRRKPSAASATARASCVNIRRPAPARPPPPPNAIRPSGVVRKYRSEVREIGDQLAARPADLLEQVGAGAVRTM